MATALRIIGALVLCMQVFFSTADGRVMINEFMTVNTGILPDLWDFDDFPDWIAPGKSVIKAVVNV